MSKYSYIFESGKYGYFIYNAVTNSFVKIGKDLKERIEQVAVWDEEALAQFPKDFQCPVVRNSIHQSLVPFRLKVPFIW